MIDLHCHLLPGIDDGPPDLEGTLALARSLVESGLHTVAATPHIDDAWGVEPLEVSARVAVVQSALDESGIALRVVPGGEISLSRMVELAGEQVDAVRLGGGPYVLLESPLIAAAGSFDRVVGTLRERGEPIVLAHPERAPLFQREPERLAELVEAGVLTSLTAGALTGRFGRTVRASALDMLRHGLVHTISSDAHDAVRRPPELRAGLRAAAEEEPWVLGHADWLTRAMPEAVLAGTSLPAAPARPALHAKGPEHRWWRRSQSSEW
ncbi:MAG: tyrosine-protein phosphatase [Solirubrobacteraceae bacterium]